MKYQEAIDLLSEEDFHVTQEKGTERAFQNAYYDNKEEGLYLDKVSRIPLFSSFDKYDSFTGWPSFCKPLSMDLIVLNRESDGRTEVCSKDANTHLGHVFSDGPVELGGKRYCMNSASLIFVSKDDLKENGLDKFISLFDEDFTNKI